MQITLKWLTAKERINPPFFLILEKRGEEKKLIIIKLNIKHLKTTISLGYFYF